MKQLHKFLTSLVQDGNAIRITSKKSGLILTNPKPFDLGKLSALAKAQGLQVMFNPTPSLYQGKLVDPCVFVGIGQADATDTETLEFLETLK
jgi:hypothetical protein